MNYVTLKSKNDIQSMCYHTPEGELGYKGLGLAVDDLEKYGFFTDKLILREAVNIYSTHYAYKVYNPKTNKTTLVVIEWIETINNTKVNSTLSLQNNKLILNSKYSIYQDTGEVHKYDNTKQCLCGVEGKHKMYDNKYLCNNCFNALSIRESYSYKPCPDFKGKQVGKQDIWFGLEIEGGFNKTQLSRFMYKNNNNCYLKSDSSIYINNSREYPAEVVTHPHSFNELMKKGSILEDISKCDIKKNMSNGCHIHISRTAFIHKKHYSLFYFLLHKLHHIAIKVGGRELTRYCTLTPIGDVSTKDNTSYSNSNRSVFLNERNENTVEARWFIGTTDTKELKAYVQFLYSMIQYTKHYTTVSDKGWFQYINKKSNIYKELLDLLDSKNVLIEKEDISIKYTPLKFRIITIDKLNYNTIPKVYSIETEDYFYEDISYVSLHYTMDASKESRVSIKSNRGNDILNISDILRIKVRV